MASNTSAVTFQSLKKSLENKQYLPVYLLHGEESYFIDELSNIFAGILPENERDFNMYIIYAQESSAAAIVDICRRFPMIAERQVVIVKDLQSLRSDQLKPLIEYLSNPTPTTILVLCMRGVKLTTKTLPAAVKSAGGITFESAKLKDNQIGIELQTIAKELGLNIEPKGISMLKDYVGTDISRLYNQLEKLATILPKGATVTPESIELNIGISKDYNNFELVDAIAEKKIDKIYRIIQYFRSNPKKNPTIVTASTVFNYFSKLLIFHYTKDKSPASAAHALGLQWESQLKSYVTGAKNYNAYKVIEIISAIREFDTKCKGIDSRQSEWDLLYELMFKITMAEGNIAI